MQNQIIIRYSSCSPSGWGKARGVIYVGENIVEDVGEALSAGLTGILANGKDGNKETRNSTFASDA